MIQRLLLAAGALLLLVVGVAWGVGVLGSDDEQRAGTVAPDAPGTPGTSVAAPASAGLDYVALGDSFSSGPLIPLMRNDASGCFRSTNNYPAYVADLLDVASYRDVSCAGAVTSDLRRAQAVFLSDTRPPPQLDALSDDTDLVTIGIGGNDYGLFGSIIGGCSRLATWSSPGSPCRDSFTAPDGTDTKARDARRIRGQMTRALAGVREAAPEADILVVGYPRLMPERGSCRAAGLTGKDAAWASRIAVLLNRSIERAADANDATFVDLSHASRGHDVCAGREAWVNGRKDRPERALGFHPFQEGMAGVARVVAEAASGERPPRISGDAEPPEGSVVRGAP